jgi:hypothetical protein
LNYRRASYARRVLEVEHDDRAANRMKILLVRREPGDALSASARFFWHRFKTTVQAPQSALRTAAAKASVSESS